MPNSSWLGGERNKYLPPSFGFHVCALSVVGHDYIIPIQSSSLTLRFLVPSFPLWTSHRLFSCVVHSNCPPQGHLSTCHWKTIWSSIWSWYWRPQQEKQQKKPQQGLVRVEARSNGFWILWGLADFLLSSALHYPSSLHSTQSLKSFHLRPPSFVQLCPCTLGTSLTSVTCPKLISIPHSRSASVLVSRKGLKAGKHLTLLPKC